MGRYEYPCPGCGQKQTTRAEGAPIAHGLCAACGEAVSKAHGTIASSGQEVTHEKVYRALKAAFAAGDAGINPGLIRYIRDIAAREAFGES